MRLDSPPMVVLSAFAAGLIAVSAETVTIDYAPGDWGGP